MSNAQAAAIIVGGFMPLLISFIKQAGLPRWANMLIAIATCAGAGVLTAWATGQLEAANLLVIMAIVFVSAEAVYAAYWKDSGIETKLSSLNFIK